MVRQAVLRDLAAGDLTDQADSTRSPFSRLYFSQRKQPYTWRASTLSFYYTRLQLGCTRPNYKTKRISINIIKHAT